jgi:hypothetical protein
VTSNLLGWRCPGDWIWRRLSITTTRLTLNRLLRPCDRVGAPSHAGVGAAAPDAWSDPLASEEVEEQIVKFGRRLHICHVTNARYGDLVGAVNARR